MNELKKEILLEIETCESVLRMLSSKELTSDVYDRKMKWLNRQIAFEQVLSMIERHEQATNNE